MSDGYVVDANELGVTLITNDKPLYAGLRERGFSGVALLSDVVATVLHPEK